VAHTSCVSFRSANLSFPLPLLGALDSGTLDRGSSSNPNVLLLKKMKGKEKKRLAMLVSLKLAGILTCSWNKF
jgi:hypothetical protein